MRLRILIPLLAVLHLAAPALAHEGHVHADEAPAPVPAQSLAPRAEANSPDFQLVATLKGEQLVVWLDRHANNEPVTAAKLELESGAYKAAAQLANDGSFVLAAGPLARPGTHPLVFFVEAGDAQDLLNLSLEVPAAPPSAAPKSAAPVVGGWSRATWVAIAALAALVLVAVWAARRMIGGSR